MIIALLLAGLIEFDEDMSPDQLCAYLSSNRMPNKDCKTIKGKISHDLSLANGIRFTDAMLLQSVRLEGQCFWMLLTMIGRNLEYPKLDYCILDV